MTSTLKISCVVACLAALSGCASVPGPYPQAYGYSQANEIRQVSQAEVIMIRPVVVQRDTGPGVGTLAGMIVGAAIGRQVGHGFTRDAATALGAIGGGSVGGSVQRATSRTAGVEIYVRDATTGRTFSVIQPYDNGVRPGDQVFVSGSGRDIRVVPVR